MTLHPVSVTCFVPGPDDLILGVSRRGRPTEFGLPGGKVDLSDKSLEHAAARELLEETGLTIVDHKMIFSGLCYGTVIYFNYVFQGKTSGEIRAEEGLVAKMVSRETLISGPFGEYNTRLFRHLKLIK